MQVRALRKRRAGTAGVVLQEPRRRRRPAAAAHDPGYLRRVVTGGLSAAEQRLIGLPCRTRWSSARGARWARRWLPARRPPVTASLSTWRAARTCPARGGQGYCVFNDVAIAALALCDAEPRRESRSSISTCTRRRHRASLRHRPDIRAVAARRAQLPGAQGRRPPRRRPAGRHRRRRVPCRARRGAGDDAGAIRADLHRLPRRRRSARGRPTRTAAPELRRPARADERVFALRCACACRLP